MAPFKCGLLAACLLSASGAFAGQHAPPPDLSRVHTGSTDAAHESSIDSDIPAIGLSSLQEAAFGYGVLSGLARRCYEIGIMLSANESHLDGILNFAALVLERNVMPPVLSYGQVSMNLPDTDTIRVADATYRIESLARFVSAPTNSRDYMLRDFQYHVEVAATSLLPINDAEEKVWEKYVCQGSDIGFNQADEIYGQSLARLERDYKAMVLNKSLLAKGMISKAYVAESKIGVTGNGNEININDRVLRITAKPQLQTKPAIWKPVSVPR
ncbi:type IV secretory system conjugative DNA transfer family protein [Pseudomonas aeruginosa]|uniref:type IV secretory system conjugative DNA transfer family protein n=1 Tax=Pseudomonas aeruginosa TaxID=287 RepID=UPI001E5F8E5B|nr:type IV secretory system conjugative DNA transfer family protein [Pseudomonas aeruginosa]MCC9290084.1 type IV secretion system DotC family protein [Pseudomonas aeruginosa]UVN19086.1 DotC [Pseudomonas aeruginosa]